MKKFDHAEQAENSYIITFYAPGFDFIGHCMESDIIDFIESNGLNLETTGVGLVCDPNGTETEVETLTAAEYLDSYFDETCAEYCKVKFKTK